MWKETRLLEELRVALKAGVKFTCDKADPTELNALCAGALELLEPLMEKRDGYLRLVARRTKLLDEPPGTQRRTVADLEALLNPPKE